MMATDTGSARTSMKFARLSLCLFAGLPALLALSAAPAFSAAPVASAPFTPLAALVAPAALTASARCLRSGKTTPSAAIYPTAIMPKHAMKSISKSPAFENAEPIRGPSAAPSVTESM